MSSEDSTENIKHRLRQYLSHGSMPGSFLVHSDVRVLDLFPAVNDELFEWFVGFTKRSAPGSELDDLFPQQLALDTLNAVFVRLREASVNAYMGEIMLAAWSVKYRSAFDQSFFAGLEALKLAAPALRAGIVVHQAHLQRLQMMEELCKMTDEQVFAKYHGLRGLVSSIREAE